MKNIARILFAIGLPFLPFAKAQAGGQPRLDLYVDGQSVSAKLPDKTIILLACQGNKPTATVGKDVLAGKYIYLDVPRGSITVAKTAVPLPSNVAAFHCQDGGLIADFGKSVQARWYFTAPPSE